MAFDQRTPDMVYQEADCSMSRKIKAVACIMLYMLLSLEAHT